MSAVPATTGSARVDRVGGRVRGYMHHHAAGAVADNASHMSRILHAYDDTRGEIGQVVGILKTMQHPL